MNEPADNDDLIDESAIEEAYQMALRASEEAGVMPPPPQLEDQTSAEMESLSQATMQAAEIEEQETVPTPRKPQLTAEQIIEALLFVGGEKLTARKLAGFIGHHCHDETVRNHIEDINARYRLQQRPYEITLGEEGYQMKLREEFQKQRNTVFGAGPREVKLPPEALEVLSFVAFQQPVLKEDLETIDRDNVMTSVRQLVRRQLVSTSKRDDGTVEYRTTDRFLKLFEISSLEDLPRPRNLNLK